MADQRLLRMADIVRITGLSKATIYRYIKAGSFPKQVKLGPRRVAWRETEIQKWISGLGENLVRGEDNFTRVAKRLADGSLKGSIVLDGHRRVRLLRIDEFLEIKKTPTTK